MYVARSKVNNFMTRQIKSGRKEFVDSLLKTPGLYCIQISPDRKWVAWIWTNIGPNADIYLASTDGYYKPKRISDFKQDTSINSWTADSKSLIVQHDYDGDERFRLYKINLSDFENPIPLTEEHPNYFIRGGQLHPNGKYLIYGANYDFETKKETEPTIVYRHNLETRERHPLSNHKKPAFVWPELNLQGTHIIYQSNELNPAGKQIWLVDIEGKANKEILNFGAKVKVTAKWHPNGVEVIFITEEKTYRKVGILNITNYEIRWILNDPPRNIEEAYVPYGSQELIIVEIKEAQKIASLIHLESLKESRLDDCRTIIPLVSLEKDQWLMRYYNSVQPTDIIISDLLKIDVSKKITDAFGFVDYSSEDLVQAENYTWKSSDNLTVQGWLYRTKVKTIGTIVYVHGGPTGHSEDYFDAGIQFFVSKGFNVFDPNYRGSTGFGLEFQELIKKDGWGGKEQIDILEGIKSLIKGGVAKPYKIGITGTSYGGYTSWFAITHFSEEFIKASAPICGMTDLVVDYNSTRPDLRGYSEEMLGGSPKDNPKKYFDASPINFVQNIKGRLLIVQCAKDPNVTSENVKSAETALQKNEIKYEKLIFDDEGHGISKPKNQRILLLKLVNFFTNAFIEKRS